MTTDDHFADFANRLAAIESRLRWSRFSNVVLLALVLISGIAGFRSKQGEPVQLGQVIRAETILAKQVLVTTEYATVALNEMREPTRLAAPASMIGASTDGTGIFSVMATPENTLDLLRLKERELLNQPAVFIWTDATSASVLTMFQNQFDTAGDGMSVTRGSIQGQPDELMAGISARADDKRAQTSGANAGVGATRQTAFVMSEIRKDGNVANSFDSRTTK